MLRRCLVLLMVGMALSATASTPKLNIKTKNGSPGEERAKEQLERLAQQYDLKKYTITRDILIERGVIPHSVPVLTLNLRFLDDDDLALSSYLHEQAHWVLMEQARMQRGMMPRLFEELQRTFPGMPYEVPEGDGEMRGSYFHIVVIMLEWQATEQLIGPERALRSMKWKQQDHYKAIYALVMANRAQVEAILHKYQIAW